ncbi:polysaccharide deacetylase family protein [Alienimonas sp. DA493]|uniref:polysaccharide deacetylase family protein n=1 Tax=Alienimonas sp. DA493 TaxID=3373605 RepID=UPI0037553C4B
MAAVASLDDLPPGFVPAVPMTPDAVPPRPVPPDCGSADAASLRFPLDSPAPPKTEALRSWLTPRLALPFGPLADRTAIGGAGALMYHRFADRVPGLPKPTWNVPPARLHAQLSGLLDRGYRAIRLEEVLDCLAAGEPTDPKTFVVTLDDGYLNNLTRGLPIFEALRVPVTLFVATGYLGSSGPFPFDDWAGKGCPTAPRESWAPMNHDELRRFADSDYVSLGAHTHTHQDFRGRPELFAADVAECCRVLRNRYGVERPALAFPYGTRERGFSGGELKAAAERTPVRCGLTTADESIRIGADPFDLGRFTATAADTAATLAAKLDGRFGALKRLLGRDGAPAVTKRSLTTPAKPDRTPADGGRS